MYDNAVTLDKLRVDLEEFATQHGLIVFTELASSGLMYHLMRRDDAHAFMLSQWEPRARMH